MIGGKRGDEHGEDFSANGRLEQLREGLDSIA
jgi:hypothetical protein